MNALLAPETVGVVGSGTLAHDELARPVGEILAELGVNLLTGGGRGVMEAVSRAFTRAPRKSGVCIGIIPCRSEREKARPKEGYPNDFVELAIYTHLPYSGQRGKDDLSRNSINILSCAALIALPGELGTASEVSLAIDYKKPLIVYSPEAALVKHFPRAAPRAATIKEVRRFLQERLGR